MKFVVRNHRNRTKLTLSAAHNDNVTKTVTLTLSGKRTIELSERVCTDFAESIDEMIQSGALIPVS